MSTRYDDWGNPIRPPPKPRTPIDLLRQMYHALRRYRTVILVCLALVALWSLPIWRIRQPSVDWSRFAYVQYATDTHNLCNSLMVFEALHRLGSKAERVLLYPRDWDPDNSDEWDRNGQLLIRLRQFHKVKLKPIDVMNDRGVVSPGTLNKPSDFDVAITKLNAFRLDEYDRLIHLDSDITVRQHLDDLFFLPPTPMAMPRSFMKGRVPEDWPLSTKLMVFEPSVWEYDNLLDILQSWRLRPNYETYRKLDMILINHRFQASAMILPHRPFVLPTSEFREKDHSGYLGTRNGPAKKLSKTTWDARRMLAEAKVVHFNDAPLPKPWIMWPFEGLAEMQPDCDGQATCDERIVWHELYDDFRGRRKNICRLLSTTAPEWDKVKNSSGTW